MWKKIFLALLFFTFSFFLLAQSSQEVVYSSTQIQSVIKQLKICEDDLRNSIETLQHLKITMSSLNEQKTILQQSIKDLQTALENETALSLGLRNQLETDKKLSMELEKQLETLEAELTAQQTIYQNLKSIYEELQLQFQTLQTSFLLLKTQTKIGKWIIGGLVVVAIAEGIALYLK